MKSSKVKFYDVSTSKSVRTDVVGKIAYTTSSGVRYALKGVSKKGNSLTVFVTKDMYDSFDVKVMRRKSTKK